MMTAKTASAKTVHKFFVPGQRIVRTVFAVLLCLLVYELRHRRGMPIFALIAAVMCIQPYTKNMAAIVRRRVIGTFIGAGWGVVTLMLEQYIRSIPDPDDIIHYLIASVGCGIVIYFTVWLNLPEMAQFAGTVFLIVVITQNEGGGVLAYAYHRIVDTIIGLAVGEFVNRIRLPRKRNTDILFASGITNTIFPDGQTISGYSLIELNRLIDDGCKFAVETIESPASIHELIRDVNLQLPVIGMDGAILYDTKKRIFLDTVMLDKKAVSELCLLLDAADIEYYMTTLEQQVLIIRHGELKNEAIRAAYEKKRISPYRNFAPRMDYEDYTNQTLYFFILDRKPKVEEIIEKLQHASWAADTVRISIEDRLIPEGYMCIRIFPKEASKERMLAKLQVMVGAKKTVTFGSTPGRYDVYIDNADKDKMVKELKKRFEPVSIKGWKYMLTSDKNN